MGEVNHLRIVVNGIEAFYREAGPKNAPVVLLPHGYPCSSYEFRNLLPLLADRWRLIAPDFPGCGYSATPDDFAYDFDGYSVLVYVRDSRGCAAIHVVSSRLRNLDRAANGDAGTATRRRLIIQNGDIYLDELGPKYGGLKDYRHDSSANAKLKLGEAVSEEGYREEFLNGSEGEIAKRISPDLWTLHWALTTERRRQIHTDVIASWWDNAEWYPRYQAYLREHRPPTLIIWGPAG